MPSRNKGILSADFLVPILGLLLAVALVEPYYAAVVRPRVAEIELSSG